MSAGYDNLNKLPVVQTLQMIIDGVVKGDDAVGILRDAVAALHLAEDVIETRRTLIACAEEMLVYGLGGRPERVSAPSWGTSAAS